MSIEKVALVTGASRGIGRAIIHALGAQGIVVVGTATTQQGAQAITEDLEASKIKGCGKVLNVSSPLETMTAVVKEIEEHYGIIRILVNNAGIGADTLCLRMQQEQWDRVIDVNLTGVFRLTKVCLRHMLKERWGRIITIGSVVGSMGNPGQVNYAAAKAGLIGFSKSLSDEVASRRVTVNVVSPGFIMTDMTARLTDEQKTKIAEKIPLQRFGHCEEVAALVAFLASEMASYITGETVHINGGLYKL